MRKRGCCFSAAAPSVVGKCSWALSIDVLYGVYRKMTERYASEKIAVVGLSFGGTFAMELVNWNNRSPEPVGMPGLIVAHSPGGTPDTEED